MLRRLWNLFAGLWFLVFAWNGTTKAGGIGYGDLWLATAPWWIGFAVAIAFRWVVIGSPRSPESRTLRPFRVK